MKRSERIVKWQQKQGKRRSMDAQIHKIREEKEKKEKEFEPKINVMVFSSCNPDEDGRIINYIFPFDCLIKEVHAHAEGSIQIRIQVARPELGEFTKSIRLTKGTNMIVEDQEFKKGDIVRVYDEQKVGSAISITMHYIGGEHEGI